MDAIVLRLLDGSVRVMTDIEFINEFRRRSSDDFWKEILCV